MGWSLLFIIFLDFAVQATAQNCSDTTTSLPDLNRRMRYYIVSVDEPFVSDERLAEKWYYVEDKTMPTNSSNVLVYRCGTLFPIWMRGSIPKVEDNVVERTVCTVGYFTDCHLQHTISVRNCGTHVLYKLGSTVSESGYCLDTSGNFIEIGNQPAFKPTDIMVSPKLMFSDSAVPGGRVYTPYLTFKCSFRESSEVLFYTVSWYVNGNHFRTKRALKFSSIEDANLNEADLKEGLFKLGITLKCTVRSSYSEASVLGNLTASLGYWVGIRVLNTTISMLKGETGTIYLETTVPLGCATFEGQGLRPSSCQLSIYMIDPNKENCDTSTVAAESSKECGKKITTLNHRRNIDWITNWTKYFENITVNITTKDDDYYSSVTAETFKLTLMTDPIATGHDIIANNYLAEVTVNVLNDRRWETKVCQSHVDPHMLTADGQPYDNHTPGEYILYRHTHNKQEVRMITTYCNGRATCVCAISIAAGGDMYIINLCNGARFNGFVSCDTFPILQVQEIQSHIYEVVMPIGTKVSVVIHTSHSYRNTMDVDISMTVKDLNSIEGMCGKFNGNLSDDFEGLLPSDFVEKWRIKSVNDSFLDRRNQNPENWNDNYILCTCQKDTNVNGSFITQCSARQYINCSKPANPNIHHTCTKKIKRRSSLNSHWREIDRVFKSIKEHRIPTIEKVIAKRSMTSYTEHEANQYCENAFQKSNVVLMRDELPLSTDTIIENAISLCVKDIMLTGETYYTTAHIDSVTRQVDSIIEKDVDFRRQNYTTVNKFNDVSCVFNCSGKGECKNGTCQCFEGFSLEDCSQSMSDPPEITDIMAGGMCSPLIDNCCSITLYGDGFIRGHTKGLMQMIQMSINGSTRPIGEKLTVDVGVESFFVAKIPSILCTRRIRESSNNNNSEFFIRGLTISLSNDNDNYGAVRSFFEYNSDCLEMSANSSGFYFSIMDNTCYIGDRCYSYGEKEPSNACNICKPVENKVNWSKNCEQVHHIQQVGNNLIVIIVVPSVIAAFTAFALLMFAVLKCNKKNKLVGDNFQATTNGENLKRITVSATSNKTVATRLTTLSGDTTSEDIPKSACSVRHINL